MNRRIPYITPVEDLDGDRPCLRLPIPEPIQWDEEEERTETKGVIVIDMVDPD